jgi:deoxyribonuclease V
MANTICGVDQAFSGDRIISAAVLLDFGSLDILERVYHMEGEGFPYVPTRLYLREGSPAVNSVKKLKTKPDILMVDGHGICHPEKYGLATFIGQELDIPTVGIAKSKLCGYFREPETMNKPEKIFLGKEQVGWVVKTSEICKPIFISPGHNISLDDSLDVTLECICDHKLPEPVMQAHFYANEVKKYYENHKAR